MFELFAAIALLASPLPTEREEALRAGAWDKSVALEARGDPHAARKLLLEAWGPNPDSYEVSVRLAWLTLVVNRPAEAIPLYRRARTLNGAGPEATRGLVSALTRDGFAALEAGERERARRRFAEAHALLPGDPEARRGLELCRRQSFGTELWVGVLVLSEPAVSGGFGFLQARVFPSDALRLRAAYRLSVTSQETSTRGAGMGAQRARTTTRTRHEGWVGAGFDARGWRAEVLGLGVFAQDTRAVPGQAARLSVGSRWGLALDEAALFESSATSLQLRPVAFAWPTASFGFSAGARFTHSSKAALWAGEVGASFVTDSVEVHLTALGGRAYKPVFLDVPLLVDSGEELGYGGLASVLFPVGESLALGVSAEAYVFDAAAGMSSYGSLAAGLRWSPRD